MKTTLLICFVMFSAFNFALDKTYPLPENKGIAYFIIRHSPNQDTVIYELEKWKSYYK
jgi:hypothetical protein